MGVLVGAVVGCSFSACPLPLAHPASSNATLRILIQRMVGGGSRWGLIRIEGRNDPVYGPSRPEDQGRTGDSAKLNTFTQRAYSGVISTGDLPPNKINFCVDKRQGRIIINIDVDKNNAVPNRGTQI